MATPKPKAPTYGELSNIRTKLEMQQKNLKSKFPNDSVKVTHTMPDGKKITLKDVNKQLNKMNPKPKSIKDVAVPVKGMTKPATKVTPKAAAKPTAKAKPKLSKSEQDFLAGQKLKAKITKKTGVYPNTAN